MDTRILNLTPLRYLCPYCGEWHEWTGKHLGNYDSKYNCIELPCLREKKLAEDAKYSENVLIRNIDTTSFYFTSSHCYILTTRLCCYAAISEKLSIAISEMQESISEPIVTFRRELRTYYHLSNPAADGSCSRCHFGDHCNPKKLGIEAHDCDISIPFGFEFDWAEYKENSEVGNALRTPEEIETALREYGANLLQKEQNLQEREAAIVAREEAVKEKEDALLDRETILAAQEQAIARCLCGSQLCSNFQEKQENT
ncbi:MAG: hypothetical protein HFJ28_00670 [Clostridia bacterium]|jgi:hypothetical protein|nr:hypothetical protein [Clostridia bacterium]